MKKQNKIIHTVLDPKAIVGIIISAGGIYWAFKDFQFVEFTDSIQKVNYLYFVLTTLLLWGSVWFRGLRWRYLFRLDALPTTTSLYQAEMIGYFGNNIMPLRLGELLRAYLIGRELNISKIYVFGTVILERILDMVSLVALAFLLLLFYPLDVSLIKTISCVVCLVFMLIFILLMIKHRLKTIKVKNKIMNAFNQMMEGLLSIRKGAILPITAFSILIWGIYYLNVYLIQFAFGFNLSFSQVLMILVFSSLVLAIPSAPGMIGTFHAAVKYTIVDLFGYAPHDGNSFAIFMHAYGYILFTVLGLYYFMKNQFHANAIQNVIDMDLKKGNG
tara:strand:+ start:676 stop:1665 length:990 start_codon:yes stop_codon:yes gene_type:complete